jgi:hypothetical protein
MSAGEEQTGDYKEAKRACQRKKGDQFVECHALIVGNRAFLINSHAGHYQMFPHLESKGAM